MKQWLHQQGLFLAWLVALLALIGSLFSSELWGLPVCTLCWYQRIALYPLALQLGIAAYYNDRRFARYALPLVTINSLIAAYQYALQRKPEWFPIHLCDGNASCYATHFQWLGFITYPFLSLTAAMCIGVLLCLAKPARSC